MNSNEGDVELPGMLNNKDFKLNLANLIIDRDKPYAFLKKITPTYWYTRPMIKFILKKYQSNNLVGAEIGVQYGLNAKTMLKLLPIKKIYLIDLYDDDAVFYDAKKTLAKFNKKIEFIRKNSKEAVFDIPNNLDFVYIDGAHEYEHVKKDIELYYLKVKEGGVIGGHDFWANEIGVCKAVIEFANKNNLKLYGKFTDWWIIK